jgi:hypothetical protein
VPAKGMDAPYVYHLNVLPNAEDVLDKQGSCTGKISESFTGLVKKEK